jgi:hypothetical protein
METLWRYEFSELENVSVVEFQVSVRFDRHAQLNGL